MLDKKKTATSACTSENEQSLWWKAYFGWKVVPIFEETLS